MCVGVEEGPLKAALRFVSRRWWAHLKLNVCTPLILWRLTAWRSCRSWTKGRVTARSLTL